MPGGKTHDIITLILSPAAAVSWFILTRDPISSGIFAAAFLLGGLMFGPDLDTNSKQYSRWSLLKPIWLPYRIFFKHRSRWTHGLVFGSLLRVVYFMGLITIGAFGALAVFSVMSGAAKPSITEFMAEWSAAGRFVSEKFGLGGMVAVFAGLWSGAASHTFTDLAGTYIKTGRTRL